MPDYTVKADVDTMLRANDKAAIRSAIGVGTTDAPTFAGVTSTGAVLAKGGLNLSGDGSFGPKIPSWTGGNGFSVVSQDGTRTYIDFDSAQLARLPAGVLGFGAGGPLVAGNTLILARDADGILAQRNGVNAQAFRVYNSTDATPATNYDRAVFDFKTTTNTLRIGTENGGTYTTARPIEFVTGGVARWQISAAGHLLSAGVTDGLYDIGASGANRPRSLYTSSIIDSGGKIICRSGSGIEVIVNGSTSCRLLATGDGVGLIANAFSNTFDRLQLGNTTDAFPAIARDGAGIKFTGAAAGSTSWIKVPAVAVASLPSAATAGVGARAFVNNALNPIFGNAVAGSGLSVVPVYSDGTNWNVG